MVQIDKLIINKLGLHARSAAKLIEVARQFSSSISLKHNDKTCDAKSILGVMTLAASCGATVTISAEGNDEENAIKAISQLIDNYFDESE